MNAKTEKINTVSNKYKFNDKKLNDAFKEIEDTFKNRSRSIIVSDKEIKSRDYKTYTENQIMLDKKNKTLNIRLGAEIFEIQLTKKG